MSKENGSTIIQNGSKIDAIKEIIFGQTMQEYDQRFENLHALLLDKLKYQKEDSDKQINAIRKEFDSYKVETERTFKALEKRLLDQVELNLDSKVDKKIVKRYLISLVENL